MATAGRTAAKAPRLSATIKSHNAQNAPKTPSRAQVSARARSEPIELEWGFPNWRLFDLSFCRVGGRERWPSRFPWIFADVCWPRLLRVFQVEARGVALE